MATAIDDALHTARQVQMAENLVGERPAYHFDGRRLEWREDISEENMERLRNAEVLVLKDESGSDHAIVLMDIFGRIRQKPLS